MVRSRGVPRRQPEAGGPTLRVLTVNLLFGRADADARGPGPPGRRGRALPAGAHRRRDDAVEAGRAGRRAAARAARAQGRPARLGIYSRFPLGEGPPLAPAYAAQPTALLELPGADAVELICVHASAPALARDGAARWRAELAALPAPGELPRVVAGDFNATLDHAAFRGVLRLGYADAAQQAGKAQTPSWGPPGRTRCSPSTTCW